MQQLLTRNKRPKGFKGEWKGVKLGGLANIKKGKQLNGEFLSKSGSYPAINGGIGPSGYTEEWNTEANTITISEGGNSCGYVNYIQTNFWCGGHCYAINDLSQHISKLFLFNLLKFHESSIMALRVGSGLPNIQVKPLEKYSLIIPSLEEQTAIASILSTSDQEIQIHRSRLAALQQQKKGLMQVLLTGKTRVNTTDL
jgi:type I restriction enzyme S subunit